MDASTLRPARLLDDVALESSSVAANCAMNRERQLAGVNSYARELGFNPLQVMRDAVQDHAGQDATTAWLDLCCGTGRALIQAAAELRRDGLAGRTALVGVDLVDAFDPVPEGLPNLRLACSPVAAWTPALAFDLISCVHGLHYIGDKLAAIARAASWLTPDGQLIADLDLDAIVVLGAARGRRGLARRLREAGFSYDSRRHRISCQGGREVRLPYRYIGADDQAGPGYTGQPAVASYYEEATDARQAPESLRRELGSDE
jgi:SAM-dependent methyltransferase